ncbi:MAG: tetratricopeptide repeat protein [Cyanobacteriota bacterium]
MNRAVIQLVAATRLEKAAFWQQTLLGQSLRQPQHREITPHICYKNHQALAITYNAAIEAASAGTVLVFCHDDVDLGPKPFRPLLEAALRRFDLVGVAGNQRHQAGQVAWWMDPGSGGWDLPFLSGALQHGSPDQALLKVYGPLPMPVQLLDGVLLAIRATDLQATGLRFDPDFPFYFYDLDFCRSARRAGLSLGTWPLPLTHAKGSLDFNKTWLRDPQKYLQKWNELNRVGGEPSGNGSVAPASESARVHSNRGIRLHRQGDFDAAQRNYGEALRLDPTLQVAGDNLLQLALQLRSLGRSRQALDAMRVILRATPQRPDLLLQLGITLMDLGRVEAAVPCFRRLLNHEPRQREGHYQLGQALAVLGHTEAAIVQFETNLALDPDAPEVLLQLEMLRLSLCDWDNYEERMARLVARLENHAQSVSDAAAAVLVPPLSLNLVPAPLALHRRLGERWATPTSRNMASLRMPPPTPRRRDRRLRIGYLSADFRDHAMGGLIHGLFTHHDRRQFEVFAYSLADREDPYTDAIRRGVDHFHPVAQESNEMIAALIRADGIDVLIDLMGHTHHSRPSVLAMRPSPRQLHYLGYPGPVGADWLDGVIADNWLIPPEHERHYRETVHRLPWAFVSSAPLDATAAPLPGPCRSTLGLATNAVVYACFNRPEKITPFIFAAWLEVLRQVPGSLLWIINDQPRVEERLRARLMKAGLESNRLVCTSTVPSAVFAQYGGLADLLLDTSPYGSGATAVTALAAGLPLLTWPGQTFAARMGASLCASAGLEELICPSYDVYLESAITLGRKPEELLRLRQRLLEGKGSLPLFNTAAWVKNLERLLLSLHEADLPSANSPEQ